MRRITLALLVVFTFVLVTTPVATHGVLAASPEKRIQKTLDDWAGRLSRHDNRYLDIMSDDAEVYFFGMVNPDPDSVAWIQKTDIMNVSDVQKVGEAAYTARVSYIGFQSRYGYSTQRFMFIDEGGKYLTITGAQVEPIYFPSGNEPAKANLEVSYPLDGESLDVTVKEGSYALIDIVNQTEKSRNFGLFEEDNSNTMSAALTCAFAGTGEIAQLSFANVPSGTYVVQDLDNIGQILATVIVK